MEKKFLEAKDLYDIREIIEKNKSLSVGVILVAHCTFPLFVLVCDYPTFTKAIEYYRDRTTEQDLENAFSALLQKEDEESDMYETKLDSETKEKLYNLLFCEKTAGPALLSSVNNENIEKVKYCLSVPQEPGFLRGALNTAVSHRGNIEITNLLLEKGAEFDTTVDIETILIKAVNNSRFYDIALKIFSSDKAKNFNQGIKDDALYRISTSYRILRERNELKTAEKLFEIMKLLLELGANPTNSLYNACYEDNTELAELFLRYGADPNTENFIATAASHNREKLVKLLLEYKANVQAGNNLALRNASEGGYYNIVKMLLQAGAKVTANTQESIREACSHGHENVVKLLLKNGANPRVRNKQALTSARKNGHEKVVAILEKWFEENGE